jgi:hypothetical protein
MLLKVKSCKVSPSLYKKLLMIILTYRFRELLVLSRLRIKLVLNRFLQRFCIVNRAIATEVFSVASKVTTEFFQLPK